MPEGTNSCLMRPNGINLKCSLIKQRLNVMLTQSYGSNNTFAQMYLNVNLAKWKYKMKEKKKNSRETLAIIL